MQNFTDTSTCVPFRVLYYNARSLLPKLDELCVLTQLESPDIICIVESWLSSEIENNEITIDNYQLVRHDRNRHGGGVHMYVKSCLSVNVLSVGYCDLELLVVSVSCLYRPLVKACYCLFYRPPSSSYDMFNVLCSALHSLSPSNFDSLVLLGDFNVDYLSPQSALYKYFCNCISPFSLTQVVQTATHFTNSGNSSLIDLVFLSDVSVLSCCSVIPPLANSDHNGVLLDLILPMPPQQLSTPARLLWNYAQADFNQARQLIDQTDWHSLLSESVSVSMCAWQTKFLEIMDQCIPRIILAKKKNLPWLTKLTVQALRKKKMLFKKAKRSCNLHDVLKYKSFRNATRVMLRHAKRHYIQKLRTCNKKQFWKAMKVLNKKKFNSNTQ